MPVFLDRGKLNPRLFVAADREPRRSPEKLSGDYINIALINNMPDLALEQTERQILKLFDAAADDLVVRLSLFAMPALPRGEHGQTHLKRLNYRDVATLSASKMDALIITGAEPRAADLRLEPYWYSLTEVLDWARDNTVSTICSCLAVHAAVLHFDGVDRHTLSRKCFGVFDFEQIASSQLLSGVIPRFRMPHSRWNDIGEDDLMAAGYQILSKGREGVDTFIKPDKSLFVFFQGHPEYEAWTLLGEYRRDIARYIAGEQAAYPDVPADYFDQQSIIALDAFKTGALVRRDKEFMAHFPTDQVASKLKDSWRGAAIGIYANWLRFVARQRQMQRLNSGSHTPFLREDGAPGL